MASRRVETRVDAADSERIDTFVRVWNGGSKRSASDALRALLRHGLEAASRPALFDERWLDLDERLARLDTVVDAIGRCVSANPAFAAWLLGQGQYGLDTTARERLSENVELLIQADWDERCRARRIPRPRYVPKPRRQPVGQATVQPASRNVRRAMLRLPESWWERVLAFAVRMDLAPLAALRHLVEMGIRMAEAETWRDDIERLLETTRRIEIQLDEIGALATGPVAIVTHLWRREKGLSDEWEQAVLKEVEDVAASTWRNIQAGPPQPAPPDLAAEWPDEDEDTDQRPRRRRKRSA